MPRAHNLDWKGLKCVVTLEGAETSIIPIQKCCQNATLRNRGDENPSNF